jgi:hypothetical protein
MTSLAFHGTSMRVSTLSVPPFQWLQRGMNATTITTRTSSIARFHSLITRNKAATVPSRLINRQNVPSVFHSRWSGLLSTQQNRTSSIVKCCLRKPMMIDGTIIQTPAMKRINPKNSRISSERVYTSMSKRHLLPWNSHHRSSTVTRMPVPQLQYRIPTSSFLQSHYTMLSLVQYYSDGGPSRFPQVNPPNRSSSNRWAQGVGILGAASVLFGKTKYVLAALKVTKLASLGSMVLSIGAYSMLFGWPYAIGVVGLIFCHECGHLAVMLNRGIPFSPMVFIPFGKCAIF